MLESTCSNRKKKKKKKKKNEDLDHKLKNENAE